MATRAVGQLIQRRSLLLAGASLFLKGNASAAGQPIVVVVAVSSATSDLGMSTLQRIFGGDQISGRDGQRVIPFNQAVQTAERSTFDRIVLGLSPDDIARYWINRRIRGQSGPPRTVPSVALMRRVVAQLKGAMGYLTADQLDGSVRAITIDGKRHTEPGYPLNLR